MIELAKHIERLLLENDCVIVPGLGGFITHYQSSSYDKETREFHPPVRTIGFNPKLVMNDGLLVQSYMQAYNTDFPDATRKIEDTVEKLKETLYQEGEIGVGKVGTLYYTMNGVYEFEPAEGMLLTPSLYGLETFALQKLAFKPTLAAGKKLPHLSVSDNKYKRIYRQWARNAAAVAATILLFFICSFPVKNTYVDEANYASLGSAGLFDAIRNQSLASSVVSYAPQAEEHRQEKAVRNNVNTLKPVAVKTEKVSEQPKEQPKEKPQASPTDKAPARPQQANNRQSYIIVASLTNAADAETVVNDFKKKGYADACVVESQGRFRIALFHYANKADAYQKANELKQQSEFASAWVFTTK